jgi:hypothetical protein
LRFAIAALDRGDALGARPLVVAVLDLPNASEPCDVAHAETYAAFGRRVGASARTVRQMVRDGRIPSSAVIGQGRGRRVLVADALAGIKNPPPAATTEEAGASYIARRRRLRVVRTAP